MAKISNQTDLSLETGMLAYTRSVQSTEGVFFATSSKNDKIRTPIEVLEKGVRGQSSEDKTDNPGKSNPKTIEFAVIPQDYDGMELSFSVQFMPLSLHPHACDNPVVRNAYMRLAKNYETAGGYRVLAELYAWNIVNGRFSWRNRFHSTRAKVIIEFEGRKIVFNPFKVSLEQPATLASLNAAMVTGTADGLERFIKKITFGLSNPDNEAFTADICWSAEMRPGQEIFPSQEYIRDAKKEREKKNLVSRVYAKLPKRVGDRIIGQASMHSQKIGAALRHIDVWHDSDDHDGAIAVNPYGGIQDTGKVLRNGSKSLYALRRNAMTLLKNVEEAKSADDISGDVHFVMANLVRGGVFGRKN